MAATDNITIELKYQYLKHDIDQWTFRLSRMRIGDAEKQSDAQSMNEGTDVSYYRRKISESIAKLKSILKNRLATKSTEGKDELKTNISAWKISITKSLYDCDAQNLADLMHKYIVRNVLVEWALTYSPDSAANLAAELQAVEKELTEEVYNRKKPAVDDNEVTESADTVVTIS